MKHSKCGYVFCRSSWSEENRREVELGIGALPQHKVAEPHLATRPNHQIGIGQVIREKVLFENRVVDILGRNFSARYRL